MAYKDFTSMPVWQKALVLLIEVYQITGKFPDSEKYGLVSDMRRAANSIVHNIAEGFGRFENKDKTRFYKISRGSAYELISQSFASNVLKYLSESERGSLSNKCKEIINEEDLIIKSIETRNIIKNPLS
jgi:four helix bundle protein